jgi:flagellum-specific peptidoglycan hydrolase FlgJ
MDSQRDQRLAEVARIAVRIEAEAGCPAPLLIAQWALESKCGAKPAGMANYFGLKKASRHQKCCTVTTHEVVAGKRIEQSLQFADYDSLEASCRDYAWLITHGAPYRAAWQQYQKDRNLYALIASVARRYATDPVYKDLTIAIASQSNVAAAITNARTVRA